MPFVITPVENNSNRQQKDVFEFSPRADSGIHSPASSMQQSPRSQKSGPYEIWALFPLPQIQSQTLPMTPMPKQAPEVPNAIRDSQPSDSNNPANSTCATDNGKIAHFATKVRKKYERIDPNSSLRKIEGRGYKDQNYLLGILRSDWWTQEAKYLQEKSHLLHKQQPKAKQ